MTADLLAALGAAVDRAREDRKAALIETVDCLDCDASGFIWIRSSRDRDDLEQHECAACHGEGVVPAEQVSTCDSCTGAFWTGSGCEHQDLLCPTCGERCRDCASERQAEADELHRREHLVLAGGGWS